jgi:PAS domain S-box-containing protein
MVDKETKTSIRGIKRGTVVLLLFIIIAGALFVWWSVQRADREMREGLLQQTRLVAQALNIERVRALSGTKADLGTSNYLWLKEQLANVRIANKKCRFIYLMGRKADNTIFFFVDNEAVGSKDEAPAGMIYDDVPEGFRRVFLTGVADTQGPFTDKWGVFVSSAVPVFDPVTGELIAVLAMDIDAGVWKWDVAAQAALPGGLMIALLLLTASGIIAARSRVDASVTPIQRRLMIPLAAVLLLLIGAFGVLQVKQQKDSLDQDCREAMEEVSGDMETLLVEQSQTLDALGQVLLRDTGLRTALKTRSRQRLLADHEPIFAKLRADQGLLTHFYFVGTDRVCLLRVHKPEKHGDLIDRFTMREAERTGRTAVGLELGPLGTFTLRSVQPVYDGDALIGYLELGKEIKDILAKLHKKDDIEIALAIRKGALDRTAWEAGMKMLDRKADWNRFPSDVLIYSSLPRFPVELDRFVGGAGHTHNKVNEETAVGGLLWQIVAAPIQDASGVEVGDLLVLHDISEATAAYHRLMTVAGGGVLALLAGLFGFIFVLLRRTDRSIVMQQAELRESEHKFRDLVETITDCIWEIDRNGVYTYVSPQITSLLGYEPKEVFGKTPFDLMPPDEVFRVKDLFKAIMVEHEPFSNLENINVHKNGQQVVLETSGVPILDDQGHLIGYRGIDRDITERKQAELAVWDREQRLNLALQGGDLGTWDWNLLTDEVIFNDQWANMKGYEPDEIEPHFSSWSKMVHPEDLPKIQEILNAYLEGETPAYEAEFRMRHKSGQWLWILDRGKIIQRDADGKPIRACGTHMDVTERKTFEQKLADERRRMANVIKGTHAGTWEWNVQTGKTIFNERWAEIVGYTLEELAPVSIKTWGAFTHPDDLKESGDLLERHFAGELQYYDCQCRMKHKDGHWVWVHDRGRVTTRTDDGKPLMMFGTHMDITEAKRAEEDLLEATARANEMAVQAKMANIAKSEFLANMSHEIRTPMNGVIGMTGLLLDTPLNEEQLHYAKTVRASGESLLGLLNDILDFSKIEAGKLDLEILGFDLQSLLDDFAATLALQAHEKGLELLCGMEPNVPVLLRGDPGRLRQILTNLAGNAVKFTHTGEVAIRVTLESDTIETVLLRFSVRDTGIGIPGDKAGLIFDKFSQVDTSTTRQFGGTGLGLAISKQLAEMMGGEIGVESEEGKGSEFWFTVCLEKQPEGTIIETPLSVDLCGVRVLIVDDNATNREILTTQMTSWKMRVSENEDGPGALESLYEAHDEKDPFRVAVIDMQMPGMDGETLGREIKADSLLADTRMVMLTSFGVRGDAGGFSKIGFDAYLTKPARALELKAVLSQVLSEHEGETMRLNTIATRHTAREAMNLFAGRKVRILLAEDNFTNQQVALGILKKLGLAAEAVANGAEAVKSLETIPYDLVLMDVQMPEMDGLDATRHIRDSRSDVLDHRIPIIAMTAHAMAGDREKCLEAGMNGYVSKPVEPLALVEALVKWLPPENDASPRGTDKPKATFFKDAQVSEPTVWDRTVMLERLMGDQDLAGTIMEGFLTDIPRQIQSLKEFLEKGDVSGVERQAHTIKGAAANVGGEALREVAFVMEKTGRAEYLSAGMANMQAIERCFDRLQQEMITYLSGRK